MNFMKKLEKVALLGAGALGMTYALPLRKYFSEGGFCLLAGEKRKQRYLKDGFIVNGTREDFVVQTPEETGICDLVILAPKYTALAEVIDEIAPCVGRDTIVLSLMNGVSSELMLREKYPAENVPNAYVIALSSEKYGNVINIGLSGIAVFGCTDDASDREKENIAALDELFTAANVDHRVSRHIIRDQWLKFMGNCGLNQISAVLNLNYEAFKYDNDIKTLLKAVFEEVVRVAAAEGVIITEEQIIQNVERLEKMVDDSTSSMCQDVRNHKKTEVDMFAGHIIELGKKHGIETPLNFMLYHMIKRIENSYV